VENFQTFQLYLKALRKKFQGKLRDIKFNSKNYDVSLNIIQPYRIYEYSSIHLVQPITSFEEVLLNTIRKYKTNVWKISNIEDYKLYRLHNFCFLPALNIKTEKVIGCLLVNEWINQFENYHSKYWRLKTLSFRIINWISCHDIIFKETDLIYKSKVINSIVKQAKHLFKNINLLEQGFERILGLSALILVGISFNEYEKYLEIGLKEIEKELSNFINKDGFVKSKNPEDLYYTLYFLVIIHEWLLNSRRQTPIQITSYIHSLGICFNFLKLNNDTLPLFNGANEINIQKLDEIIRSRGYAFNKVENIFCGFGKIKHKKIEILIDGNTPASTAYAKNYQAGALSFELYSSGQKFITNTGSGKYSGSNLSFLSSTTAAHSTLNINDTSSCIFQKNKLIAKHFGNSLINDLDIYKKEFKSDKATTQCILAHNGYEKRFGIKFERQITLFKDKNTIEGLDTLILKNKKKNFLTYSIRFHVHPDIRITKTMGNDILLSSDKGDGWIFRCTQIPTKLEKNLYLGNPDSIKENFFILLEGQIESELTNIIWYLEKAK